MTMSTRDRAPDRAANPLGRRPQPPAHPRGRRPAGHGPGTRPTVDRGARRPHRHEQERPVRPLPVEGGAPARDDRCRRGDLRRGRGRADARGRARHPGRAGPARRLPRSPRPAGLSRVAASSPARPPRSSRGRVRSRSGSPNSIDAGWRGYFETTSASPRPPATWPRPRTSTRSCFELDAYLLYAHAAFAFRGDPAVLERAGRGGPRAARRACPPKGRPNPRASGVGIGIRSGSPRSG